MKDWKTVFDACKTHENADVRRAAVLPSVDFVVTFAGYGCVTTDRVEPIL